MSTALQALDQALDAPRRPGVQVGNWRWVVRQRMSAVRDSLVHEVRTPDDSWLAARGGSAFRQRNALMARLNALAPQVLEHPDVETVRLEMKRLLGDIARHLQRLHDLAYDDVELELGGSE
jgi:hypothetical protein